MKSMCTTLSLMRGRSESSPTGAEYASPSARWLAAFSSSSVVKNVRPSLPIRLSRSTSATSPSRDAPSSIAQRCRSASTFVSASISTARPPSKRMRRPVDERARDVERLRRGDDALRSAPDPASCRPLRSECSADGARPCVSARPALLREARARQQADREVGSRARRSGASRGRARRACSRSARSGRFAPARPPPGRARRAGRRARCRARGARAPRRSARPDRRSAPSRASDTARASTRPSGRRSP